MFPRESSSLPATRVTANLPARSGGPRTVAGKRRSSVNSLRRGLCPPWVARDLRVRGEDAARFARLHRELIAWLQPDSARTRVIVETLAEVWWEKLRRVRNWVGAGAADTSEVDHRIDDLLFRFAIGWGTGRRKWRHRLESVFGRTLSGPGELRQAMQARLLSLGGKAPARKRPSWRSLLGANTLEAEAWNAARRAGGSARVAENVDLRDEDLRDEPDQDELDEDVAAILSLLEELGEEPGE
jgi:hypothetical protein